MIDLKTIFTRPKSIDPGRSVIIEKCMAATQPYRIHYRVAGPEGGPVILLLHGLALSSFYLKPLIRTLAAEGYRVYAPDLPGTGHSQRIGIKNPLTVAEVAEILANWVEVVGLVESGRQFHLVAHSAGAQPAIEMALQNSSWIETLTLISATGGSSVRGWIPLVLSIGLDAFWEHNLLVPIAIIHYFSSGVIETLQSAYYHCKEQVLPKAAALSQFPTLVIWAGRDVVTPLRFGRELAASIEDSRLVVLPRATHGLAYSQYRDVARTLHEFLSEPDVPMPLELAGSRWSEIVQNLRSKVQSQ